MAERRDSEVSSGEEDDFTDSNDHPADSHESIDATENGEKEQVEDNASKHNVTLDKELDDESDISPDEAKANLEDTSAEKQITIPNGKIADGEKSPFKVTTQSKEPSDTLLEPTSPPVETPREERPTSPQKKLRNAFSWLSRSSTSESKGRPVPTPPLPPRRGTATSLTSNGSDVAPDSATMKKHNRQSLKDRFDSLRLKELAASLQEGEEEETSRSGSPEHGQETKEKTDEAVKSRHGRSESTASTRGQPKVNGKLPPGTAAGFATGPSSGPEAQVDWDLWQEVVYEGPAAVARTSPDELNKAITNGIPSAIRGVIWQVLAQSKNEELETYYWSLVDRGKRKTDNKSPSRPDSIKKVDSNVGTEGREKANRTSSAESLKSEATSRPTSPNSASGLSISAVTSPDGRSPNLSAEQMLAQEKKRADEDANAMRKLEKAIKRDMGARTSYSQYLMSSGLQDGLFGICKAYALFDDAVGYAQGMNFIAMPLLFNMPEEEAFCLFVRLMNHYRLRDMFIQDMPGLHLHLYQFERLLEDFEPALYCHLHRRGVSPQLYATQWFLTLFAYRFPLQLVLRIYDLILSEGLESAILKFGIVLMQKNAEQLLKMKDMAALTTFLKERIFDVYIDASPSASSVLDSGFFGSTGGVDKSVYKADALVEDACAVRVDAAVLKAYAAEWEEKVRTEKQKIAEEEALRATNKSLTLKVRALEENTQKSDVEHTQIASELVRIKVENERLREDKEGLQGQIKELQEIIQAQPGEVEEKLQNEMNRIMERNGEVQNQNRHLEDALSEMEHDLVETKLKLAETFSKLESFQAQWTNAQAAMNALNPNAMK